MQVEVDVKCMETNFGGRDLSGFKDFAHFSFAFVAGTTEKIGTVHTTEVTKVIRLLRKGVFHHDMDAVSDIMELLTTRTYIVQELSMKVSEYSDMQCSMVLCMLPLICHQSMTFTLQEY